MGVDDAGMLSGPHLKHTPAACGDNLGIEIHIHSSLLGDGAFDEAVWYSCKASHQFRYTKLIQYTSGVQVAFSIN
jgi:hypothetical protein